MPGKNVVKQYIPDTFYHLYNHAVGKELLFNDKKDYTVFLTILKKYLSAHRNPINLMQLNVNKKSLIKELSLVCYCLMPNHYHLLVKQTSSDAITKIIRRVCTSYVLYFNEKYKRVGTLFVGKYKAVLVKTDTQLLHLSRYIHLNPQIANICHYDKYPYSSINNYLGLKKTTWVKTKYILDQFSKNPKTARSKYQQFIKGFIGSEKAEIKKINHLILEKI
jgi:putative transposase